MTDLTPLISRLEAATGGDREIDCAVVKAVFGVNPYPVASELRSGDWWFYSDTEALQRVPAYTASLDAALALVERTLPGWRVENLAEWHAPTLRANGPWLAQLCAPGHRDGETSAQCDHARTPALALLTALLAALQAKERT